MIRFVGRVSIFAAGALALCAFRANAQTAPPASGELFGFTSTTGVTLQQVTVTQQTGRFQTAYLPKPSATTGTSYPAIRFPIPTGGWNLSSFGGIQVCIGNPGTRAATVSMRIDNNATPPEDDTQTESLTIAPGETRLLKVYFGKSSAGINDYPLSPSPIGAIQVFMYKPYSSTTPGETTTLLLSNLRAIGTAADRGPTLSTPADRNTPVTPPAWVGTQPPVAGSWVQTLNENFSGTSLDSSKWSLEHGWGNGTISGQTQRYTQDNLEFSGSTLKMRTENRPGYQYDNPAFPYRTYATGSIDSYDRWTQLYGYFEARVKLPTARGLWPAFWMMPDRGAQFSVNGWEREDTWNSGMEIDIMEHLTEWGPGRMNVAAHWDGYNAGHQAVGNTNNYYGPTPDDFHTFGVLWEPGKLTWYVDGAKKSEWASARVGSVPAYLILNVQTGGWATTNVNEAALPDYYEIDWVRAWQRTDLPQPPSAGLTVSPTSDWTGVSGNKYPSGRATTLRVASVDKDGTVSKIEFYDNGVKIGEDLERTRDVFHFYVTGPTDGTHVYQAKAIDNAGKATWSQQATIIYGTIVAPTVSITAPATSSQSVYGTAINLTASATDADGTVARVEFYDDGTKIGEDTITPFTLSITNAAVGPHNFTAKAYDNANNNSAVSTPVTVFVTLPPSVTLTSPTNGATFADGTSINLAANASDLDDAITQVAFYAGGTKITGSDDTTAPYAFTWTPATGRYLLTAKATDAAGNVTTSSAITVTVGTPGTGLKAEYYSGANFNTLIRIQRDPYVYYSWGASSPGSSIPADNFSVRWTGQVKPLYSETYTFNTITSDGVRLWVNGVLLIDKWQAQEPSVQNGGTITLTAGQLYDVKMEFYEGTGNAEAKLIWTSPSQIRQYIPTNQLYPAP